MKQHLSCPERKSDLSKEDTWKDRRNFTSCTRLSWTSTQNNNNNIAADNQQQLKNKKLAHSESHNTEHNTYTGCGLRLTFFFFLLLKDR